MKRFSAPFLFFAPLILALGLMGMAGRGGSWPGMGKAELRPEARLKIYNEAIEHYEKAKALYEAGKQEAALKELKRATKVFSGFPEAYGLAQKIYLELGDEEAAAREERLFREHEGHKGASLYKLREKVHEQVLLRKKQAPTDEIPLVPSFLLSACLALVLAFGMIYEHRLRNESSANPATNKIFLEPFPSDREKEEAESSGLFKLYVLVLPAPVLFTLLLAVGFRSYSDLIPIFLFSWAVVDAVIYLLFFADFSGMAGFRRPGGMV